MLQWHEDRADGFTPLRVKLKLLLCILHASPMESCDLESLIISDCFSISWNKISDLLVLPFVSCQILRTGGTIQPQRVTCEEKLFMLSTLGRAGTLNF